MRKKPRPQAEASSPNEWNSHQSSVMTRVAARESESGYLVVQVGLAVPWVKVGTLVHSIDVFFVGAKGEVVQNAIDIARANVSHLRGCGLGRRAQKHRHRRSRHRHLS